MSDHKFDEVPVEYRDRKLDHPLYSIVVVSVAMIGAALASVAAIV